MARWRTLHRTDRTSKLLIAAVEAYGGHYAAADGTFDGVVWCPDGRIELVDWKASEKAEVTKGQAKLLAAGWPLRLVWNVDQVRDLLACGAKLSGT